jgi:hypothetical protein
MNQCTVYSECTLKPVPKPVCTGTGTVTCIYWYTEVSEIPKPVITGTYTGFGTGFGTGFSKHLL